MLPWIHPSPHSKRYFDRFSRICTAHGSESLYFTVGRPFPTQNYPFPHRGYLDPQSITRLRGPTGVQNPNGISIGSAVFAGIVIVTDRQTDQDRQTKLLGNNRPHLHT